MPFKSLEEFNRDFLLEYQSVEPEAPQEPQKRQMRTQGSRDAHAFISDILFYLAVAIVLFTFMTSNLGSGPPRMILGYSYFTVLTSSMQDEIPKGAFILVHKTDPSSLKVGDNITYMRDRSTSVTHKIVGIIDNYDNSGTEGFQTKGVNNSNPDKDIVFAANVVGKVVLVLPGLGAAIYGLRANLHILFIMFALCVILSFTLRGVFGDRKKIGRRRANGRTQ